MLCMWTQEYFNKLPSLSVEHIASALKFGYGEREVTDVAQDLIDGNKQIWIGTLDSKFVATVVTQIIDYPSKRTCEICYLGGEGDSGVLGALSEVKEIEDWAVINNCNDIQIYGRRGWVKALKEHGYTDRYTIIVKSLGKPSNNKDS